MPPSDGWEQRGGGTLAGAAGVALGDAGADGAPQPLQTGSAGVVDESARRIRREHLAQLLHSKAFLVGALMLLFWIVCAIFGSMFVPYSPLAQNLVHFNTGPSAAHWFGRDYLGRDVFSRVIAGSREILFIAPLTTLLGAVVGAAIGLAQGYFRGAFDAVVGRLIEAILSLPVVIVAFLFVVALGPSPPVLIIVVGFVFAAIVSRTIRTAVLQEIELDYVASARLRGESAAHIMFIEIFPNVLSPLLVEFTVRLGYAIFTVADLSFLGFGIQPPTPSWGADIANSYQYLSAGYWWETLFPALAIASLVIAVNLVSDSIEGVLLQ